MIELSTYFTMGTLKSSLSFSREMSFFEPNGIQMSQKNLNEMQLSASYTQHKAVLPFNFVTEGIPYCPQEPKDWCALSFSRRNKNQEQN